MKVEKRRQFRFQLLMPPFFVGVKRGEREREREVFAKLLGVR
jgi:hypothetical protein